MLRRILKRAELNKTYPRLGCAPSTRRTKLKLILASSNNSFSTCEALLSENENSPISLDENHSTLANEYLGRDSEFINRQNNRQDYIISKAENNLKDEYSKSIPKEDALSSKNKAEIVSNFNQTVDLEKEFAIEDLKNISNTRDDVLGINDGRFVNSPGSDYNSDYESPTSQN